MDFIMPLVKGMQEQQALIEALKKENETLNSELKAEIKKIQQYLKLTEER